MARINGQRVRLALAALGMAGLGSILQPSSLFAQIQASISVSATVVQNAPGREASNLIVLQAQELVGPSEDDRRRPESVTYTGRHARVTMSRVTSPASTPVTARDGTTPPMTQPPPSYRVLVEFAAN
jgi:hypothetical protein